jgi:transcriptional regulator with GAF, ATPase, and Fis domain
MSQAHSFHQRFEHSGSGDVFANCEALPFGAMVRAICGAASGGPDLLYEMMLKAMLMVDGAAPMYGLSTWSLTFDKRPRLQWADGLTPEELEEAEQAVTRILMPGFDGVVRTGDQSLCFLLVAPGEMREGGAIYGRYVRPLNESQGKCLGALSDVARLARSHIELLQMHAGAATATACAGSIPRSTLPGMIFTSRLMSEVAGAVERIKDSESTILITGESGTGKELVARAIHRLSRRSEHNFVPFNCTAGPADLIESTLFGHRRGAFTGALTEQLGVIRAAEGGTLFLDEIGDLPLSVQPKLLRFLQESEIHPLGERTPRKVSVRVLAATHKNLEAAVREGTFRADLYYRVTGLTVHLPPLRERPDDIRELISHFLTYYARRNDRAVAGITADAIQALQGYSWPGNVRELAAEIERLVLYAEAGSYITPNHISPRILPLEASQRRNGNGDSPKLEHLLADFERRVITETLKQHDCNVARASEALGLGSRQTLYKKLKRLTIDISEFLQEDTEPGLQLRTPQH